MDYIEILSARRRKMLHGMRRLVCLVFVAALVALVYRTPDGMTAGAFANIHFPYEMTDEMSAAGLQVAGGDHLTFFGVRWYWIDLLSSWTGFLLWAAAGLMMLKRRPKRALKIAAAALLLAEAMQIWPRWSGYHYVAATPESEAAVNGFEPDGKITQSHIRYLRAQFAYQQTDLAETATQLAAISPDEMIDRQVSAWRINVMMDWISRHGGESPPAARQPAIEKTNWRLWLSRSGLAAALAGAAAASLAAGLSLALWRRERRISALISETSAVAAKKRIVIFAAP